MPILLVLRRPRGWRPDHPLTCSASRCTLPTLTEEYNAPSSGRSARNTRQDAFCCAGDRDPGDRVPRALEVPGSNKT
jgi:hypothetical protein